MKLEKWQEDLVSAGELYRVGGAVRDELLGVSHRPEDVDYVVRGVPAKELERLLTACGRLAFVGRSFGVYKFRPAGSAHEYDIAFPRKEVSIGPGHRDFSVTFDESLPLEADLGRRDFTINAMARNVRDGRLVDPFGGRRDLESRTLRMVFADAFREDPLRVLRGVRFAARFGLTVEPATLRAMTEAATLLSTLSAERLQDELTGILLQCDTPSTGFELLRRIGGLAVVLPELERGHGVAQNEYHPDDVYWHTLKTVDCAPRDNLDVRWAALLHDLGKVDLKKTIRDEDGNERVVFYGHEELGEEMAEEILRRLRYSNAFVTRCKRLVRHHMFHYHPDWNRSTVRRFIRRVGEENLENLLVLRVADMMSRGLVDEVRLTNELRQRAHEEVEASRAFRVEDLAVDGRDVMAVLGVAEGPVVGGVLEELFELVLEDPTLNTRERLLAWLERRKSERIRE